MKILANHIGHNSDNISNISVSVTFIHIQGNILSTSNRIPSSKKQKR